MVRTFCCGLLAIGQIAEVIGQASNAPVPCLVGTAQIEIAGWNTNRRHPDGAVDNQLTVTRIDSHDGKPLAALVNWTAHPTFMSADDMWFSGGWPGHLQRTLGIPGELAAELGLSIKRQTATITAVPSVTIGGLANEWVSYILPRAEYEQGGYEASVSFYGASLGKTIVAGAIAGVRRLGTPATEANRSTQ